MSQHPYDFNERLSAGAKGEAYLDQRFKRRYEIMPASDAEQRTEIDRWFTNRESGNRFSVEYKTDALANRTGNAFVELLSVVERDVPGWAVMSEAKFLIYFCPDPDVIYIIYMEDLRKKLSGWKWRYERKQVPNKGYTTEGILVPLHVFEQIAVQVRS